MASWIAPAAAGAVTGLAGLFGIGQKKDKFHQLPTLNKQQQGGLSGLFGQLQGGVGQNYGAATDYLSQMLSGSPEAYNRFAAPYRTEFQEQTIPRLAERFAGIGGGLGGGALGSSGFGQAIGGAANQFQSNLANLYAQLQQQAAQSAMGQYGGLLGMGLNTRAFENLYQPGSTGLAGGILGGMGQGFGQGAGLNFGNQFQNWFNRNNQPNQQQKGNYNSNDELNWFS